MKRRLFLSLVFLFLGFNISCQTSISPATIGRELFNSIKASSNSNNDKFSSLFLKREDGNLLYREIATNGCAQCQSPFFGVSQGETYAASTNHDP